MIFACLHQQRTIGWHHPGIVRGFDPHYARNRIDQLISWMVVWRDEESARNRFGMTIRLCGRF